MLLEIQHSISPVTSNSPPSFPRNILAAGRLMPLGAPRHAVNGTQLHQSSSLQLPQLTSTNSAKMLVIHGGFPMWTYVAQGSEPSRVGAQSCRRQSSQPLTEMTGLILGRLRRVTCDHKLTGKVRLTEFEVA